MSKVHNFSAGPAILPQSAIDASIEALKNFSGTGLSLLEVSHRSKEYEAVVNEATQLVKEILKLNDDYSVIFLQGGASLQFDMIPMNWLGEHETAAYLNTGVWANRAIKEAKMFGNVNVVASSEEANFNYIPKGYNIPQDAKYFHCTSNNTIYGTEMFDFPDTGAVPLVCDMSSDIFSRPVNAEAHALIYAGAQKNLGPAGTTLYIVDMEQLGKTGRKLPIYMDLKAHVEKDSMYNTPPVLAVYTCMLTLRWIKAQGGLAGMEKRNHEKQSLFYSELDRNGMFEGHAVPDARSWMNPTFRLVNDALTADFDAMWKEAGISGIAGHRSVGGYRASMYNALPVESVQVLVEVMKEFERIKG